ncbi:MAG: hypothetical protein B7733_25470 [Myxococcales bacterium FL481]|nr:MAG: hypothetical protein B7733_25470 [Myxococcales bacterium FL481]
MISQNSITDPSASANTAPWERRKRRSDNTADALEYALDSAAQRGQLDAVLIVDDFGLLVSQSRHESDLREVAAITPIVGRGQARATVRHQGQAHQLSVRTVSLLGEHLHVAAVGGNDASRRREIATAIRAARRILAA